MMTVALCLCMLTACGTDGEGAEQTTTQHVHVPDGANCQEVQYCADCGEQIAEQGAHQYPEEPDAVQDGFAYYTCKLCGNVKVVNSNGMPVVPVE